MTGGQRDLVGYGCNRPTTRWPGDARLAISLVVNYEEGSERTFAAGDATQESLTDWGAYPFPGEIRNLAMESMHEYGSRVGVWRILETLERHAVPSTFFACAVALEQAPDVARAAVRDGHEMCSHGYRWEEVFRLSRDEEREHIRLAVESIERTCGQRPLGWYCRYGPSVHTRELLVEEGGFIYDSDAYNDEVPYFTEVSGKRHLVIPYTPDVNDIQFWLAEPLATSDQFFSYLRDTFDVLYDEAAAHPRMMSVGLHCRILGRPGRIRALDRFIAYAKGFPEVWFATRLDIARWWLDATEPHSMPRVSAVTREAATGVARVTVQEIEPAELGGGASSRILLSQDNVRGAGTTLARSTFPPGAESDPIMHDTEEWMFVIAGTGEVRTDHGTVPFEPDVALHIPAGVWHGVANTGTDHVVALFGFPGPGYPATHKRTGGIA